MLVYRKGRRRLVQYEDKIVVAFVLNHPWNGCDDEVGDNQISCLTSTYRIDNDRLVIACFLCCEYTHVHALTCLGDGCILVNRRAYQEGILMKWLKKLLADTKRVRPWVCRCETLMLFYLSFPGIAPLGRLNALHRYTFGAHTCIQLIANFVCFRDSMLSTASINAHHMHSSQKYAHNQCTQSFWKLLRIADSQARFACDRV
jgi:hypothetical protein